MKRALLAFALVALCVTSGIEASTARAADLPPDLKLIVGTPARSAADLATHNTLQLNTTMFELYGDAATIFTKNLRAQHPIILGLFSGAGGRFIL